MGFMPSSCELPHVSLCPISSKTVGYPSKHMDSPEDLRKGGKKF